MARFLSILFIALSLAPALGHRLELPAKIRLSRGEYLTVQQIYRGWAMLGIVIFAAILATLATLATAVLSRRDPGAFRLSLAALLLLIGAQVVFWVFTFPANRATQNWTSFPPDWMALRDRWEYSHAAGACMTLGAFLAATLSAFAGEGGRSDALTVRKETA